MVRWAVRRSDRVIDPSFGEGVFLAASSRHVADPSEQLYGIELDEHVYGASKHELNSFGVTQLWRGDFFASDRFLEDTSGRTFPVESFDVVLGNPPFIRYQTFKGEARERALKRAADLGVHLPGHVSSWAPFLVHAVSLIKPGGRLAMVAPAELGHAAYAKNVLAFLVERFSYLRILTFRKRLFPKLGEDTVIVLGEAKGGSGACLQLIDVESEEVLGKFSETNTLKSVGRVKVLRQGEVAALEAGRTRLQAHLLDARIKNLYDRLSLQPHMKAFGSLTRVGIGYVTGNNTFFHLSQKEIDTFCIPARYCTPCVRRSADLKGLFVSEHDWRGLGEPEKWLLELPASEPLESLPEGLKSYLLEGERRGVHQGYKTRKRNPWYAVPHIKRGAAFLTYMSNLGPRLVHNPLALPAPNTLHTVEIADGSEEGVKRLIVSWYTSLTFLSAELCGHSLGGGMLKLEPGEARKVLMALPEVSSACLDSAYRDIDVCLREGRLEGALDIGDTLVLQEGLGLKGNECDLLRQGYHYLRDRRMRR